MEKNGNRPTMSSRCALIAPDDGQASSPDNCTLFHVADFVQRGRNLLYGGVD